MKKIIIYTWAMAHRSLTPLRFAVSPLVTRFNLHRRGVEDFTPSTTYTIFSCIHAADINVRLRGSMKGRMTISKNVKPE